MALEDLMLRFLNRHELAEFGGLGDLPFSVLNALVLTPLPVDEPERLVFVETPDGGVSHSFPL